MLNIQQGYAPSHTATLKMLLRSQPEVLQETMFIAEQLAIAWQDKKTPRKSLNLHTSYMWFYKNKLNKQDIVTVSVMVWWQYYPN